MWTLQMGLLLLAVVVVVIAGVVLSFGNAVVDVGVGVAGGDGWLRL